MRHPARPGRGRAVHPEGDRPSSEFVGRVADQAPVMISRMSRAVSRRRLADLDADGLEGLLLGLRGARRAGHDRAGVAHRLALGGGEAGDVADDRLGDVVLDVRRRALLGVAADLADHDDRVGLGVGLERREAVDVRGADDGVAADAHGRGEAEVAQLVHHLVGQRARLGHQPDAPGLGDGAGDDARVGLAGADQAGAVRARRCASCPSRRRTGRTPRCRGSRCPR